MPARDMRAVWRHVRWRKREGRGPDHTVAGEPLEWLRIGSAPRRSQPVQEEKVTAAPGVLDGHVPAVWCDTDTPNEFDAGQIGRCKRPFLDDAALCNVIAQQPAWKVWRRLQGDGNPEVTF